MTDNGNDVQQQVQNYRNIVLLYEAVDEEIDQLFVAHGGMTDKMSPEDLAHYRTLARQRDELQNEMRALERKLLLLTDDENESETP